jgi:hypothetical protein
MTPEGRLSSIVGIDDAIGRAATQAGESSRKLAANQPITENLSVKANTRPIRPA